MNSISSSNTDFREGRDLSLLDQQHLGISITDQISQLAQPSVRDFVSFP